MAVDTERQRDGAGSRPDGRCTGNFVGRDANGLVFSTFLQTGNGGSASGVQLFTRPPGN